MKPPNPDHRKGGEVNPILYHGHYGPMGWVGGWVNAGAYSTHIYPLTQVFLHKKGPIATRLLYKRGNVGIDRIACPK